VKKKPKPAGERRVVKVPLLTVKDAREYEEIRARLIARLKQFGSYEGEVDDLHVDAIARATIYLRKSEELLDREGASEETYSRVADAQAKLRSMTEKALHELNLTRRERMATQAGKAGEEELVRQILEALKNRPNRPKSK
jgi:hypothetical protein